MSKKFLCCASFIALALTSQPLFAGFRYQTNLSSSYIWRGFDLNPTQKMVLQPSVDYVLGSSGIVLNMWSSFSFVNQDVNEVDFTINYTHKTVEDIQFNAGFIHYGWYFVEDFSWKDHTSQELFVSAGLPEPVTQPVLTVFYDFGNGNGFYLLLETSHSLKITSSIQTDLSVSLGYNGGQWLAEGENPGISDLNVGATVLFKLRDLAIAPFANYTLVFLDALGKKNFFWFGIGIGYKKEPAINP